MKKSRHTTTEHRYAPAQRLNEVRALLSTATGVSLYDIRDRFSVSIRTAIRLLRAVERGGDPLYEELDGKRKIWRIMPTGREESITLTLQQMATLFLSRRVFDFLEGTGLKEDLDDVFQRLEKTVQRKDRAIGRHLDKKLFDVNEAPYIYKGRLEHVDQIVSALLKEERLRITHESLPGKSFLFDPYTLVVYKKGLYLAGLSHHHNQILMHNLDGITHAEWMKRDAFAYPDDYHPSKLVDGAFGLIRDERTTHVKIFFTDKVAKYVRRRRWHRSQKIKKVEGGVELEMDAAGITELKPWVLGWGEQAEVLEPDSLREEIADELRRAVRRYDVC